MLYNLNENLIKLNEIDATFWNKSSVSDILLFNAINVESVDLDNPILIKAGEKLYLRARINSIFAKTVKGSAGLSVVEGFTLEGNVGGDGGELDPLVLKQINENTEQLQNCIVKVDGVVEEINGNGTTSNGLMNSNAICIENNEGVSQVLVGDDFSAVWDIANQRWYVGEGYENIFSNRTLSLQNHTKLGTTSVNFQGDSGWVQCIVEEVFSIGETIYVEAKVRLNAIESGTTTSYINLWGDGNTGVTNELILGADDVGQVFNLKGFATVKYNNSKPYVRATTGSDDGIGIDLDIFDIFINRNKVPFVQNSFEGGKMQFNPDLSVQKNSFIFKVKSSGEPDTILYTKTGGSLGHNYTEHARLITNDSQKYFYVCVSNTSKFSKKIETGIVEQNVTAQFEGVGDYFNLISRAEEYYSNGDYIEFFAFEGDYTEEMFLEKLEKLESGNYLTDYEGSDMPLSGVKVRRNDYGIVQDHIEVSDRSRDLWHLDGIAMYEVIDNDLATHYVRVNDDASITGTALEDVSGRLRVAAAIELPAQIRKVK